MPIGIVGLLAGKYTAAAPAVPTGLIIAYDGTVAPAGWTLFTSALDKYIIGAGSTYAVAATGGSESLTPTTSSAGNCINPLFTAGASNVGWRNADTGASTHTYTFSSNPLSRKQVLIKAGASLTELPAKGIVYSNQQTLGTLTQLYDTENSVLYSDDATGTRAATTSATPTSSACANHTHTGIYGGADGGEGLSYPEGVAAGAHDHVVTVDTFTWAMKKRILTAFSDAAAAFNIAANFIGLYENTTPPAGWALCNGASGTPDMRDYFVYFGAKANVGDASGDNTMGWSYSAASAGAHSHNDGHSHMSMNTYDISHGTAGAHTHTGSPTGEAYLPPYYALAFIIYTG
jgi:hypothetical protein